MEWRETGEIWIVECADDIRSFAAGEFIAAMVLATGTGNRHLVSYSQHHDEEPQEGAMLAEPDCSFGPEDNVGAVLATGIHNWCDFQTVKVEIGVCRGWSVGPVWRGYDGVQYMSIHLSPALQVLEFRFEELVNGDFPPTTCLIMPPILAINDQNAMLHFDAHRLLGLPTGANLPTGFNNPVDINIHDLVQQVQQQYAA